MCVGLWHARRVVPDGVNTKLGLFAPSFHLNQEVPSIRSFPAHGSQCNSPFPKSCPLLPASHQDLNHNLLSSPLLALFESGIKKPIFSSLNGCLN